MRPRTTMLWIVAGCILAMSGCSKAAPTEPQAATHPTGPFEFKFDARFTYADSGYIVRDMEYADPSGVVHKINFQPPVWNTTMEFMSGDRLYLRAEVEYPSGLAGIVQILGPPGFYRSDRVESLDGPKTVVLQIDEQVK